MKKVFTFLLINMLTSIPSIAQIDFNNQLIVYFKSGVQRMPAADTAAAVTSPAILNLLNSYGIPLSNIVPSFPSFKEADTVSNEIGESSRQMNRARVFTITMTNPATKQSSLNAHAPVRVLTKRNTFTSDAGHTYLIGQL